jgi:hypothetical protein
VAAHGKLYLFGHQGLHSQWVIHTMGGGKDHSIGD